MNYLFFWSFVFFSSNGFAEFCESRNGFQDTPNGCKHRGLVWSAPSDAPMTASQAQEYCAAKPKLEGTERSWRLPSLEEFGDFARGDALSVLKRFDAEQLYWTSSKEYNVPRVYFLPSETSIGIEDPAVKFRLICILPLESMQISLGTEHACSLADGIVKCWGNSYASKTDVPHSLNQPSHITAGKFYTCALDRDGVKCWGDSRKTDLTVPNLRNPIQISAGYYHVCALDTDGIKCWGNNDRGQTNVPALKYPTHIFAGAFTTCALDADGFKCWGSNAGDIRTKLAHLKEPTQVYIEESHFCALSADGVTCWKYAESSYIGISGFEHSMATESVQTETPTLNHPFQVCLGPHDTCAIDQDGLKCWNDYAQIEVPPLKRPRKVSAASGSICAIDDDGIKCWGNNYFLQNFPPELSGKSP
ncbi:MAG: hypothetical protein NTV34_08595 [Proteobacteria bacterium]|nr:hypothetical protein [Pseudomonadota bacterium]